jgi:hypothetical protein
LLDNVWSHPANRMVFFVPVTHFIHRPICWTVIGCTVMTNPAVQKYKKVTNELLYEVVHIAATLKHLGHPRVTVARQSDSPLDCSP